MVRKFDDYKVNYLQNIPNKIGRWEHLHTTKGKEMGTLWIENMSQFLGKWRYCQSKKCFWLSSIYPTQKSVVVR